MKYKGTYYNMWDAWYVNDGDKAVHVFHLKSHAGEDWNVGHARTEDLLHFTRERDVLEALPEDKYPEDCLGKFTGCAVKKDGVCYLYYTMRDRYRSEKIGLALSEDMEHFKEYENNPVLVPDSSLFCVRPKGEKTDCRDMHIVYDHKTARFYGYFAAMAVIDGRGEIGVIGVAQSTDLVHWKEQKIVYVPDFNGVIEVPNVFELDGRWYMTLMSSAEYGAKGAISDPNLTGFIYWAASDTPDGSFTCREDNLFFGSSRVSDSGYACKSVVFRGKTYVMYIDRSADGAAFSLPKEVRAVDGAIYPFYTDILQKLRMRRLEASSFTRVPCAFAWKHVVSGALAFQEDGIHVTGFPKSLQEFKADGVCVPSLEAEFTVSGDFKEAGVVLYCSPSPIEDTYTIADPNGVVAWNGYVWSGHHIAFCPEESLIKVDDGMGTPKGCRRFDFRKKTAWHVRVIALEGQLEVYIDDVLYMQCGLNTESYIGLGLFAFSGEAVFNGLTLYELENGRSANQL